MSQHLLQLQGVSLSFGGLKALDNVSFTVRPGEIIGLIGPNGAGKTTLVNACTGVHRPSKGRIVFEGMAIQGLPAWRVAHLGMARTFQIVQPFPRMSVLDNVAAAALFGGGIRNMREAREFAAAQLDFVAWKTRPANRPPRCRWPIASAWSWPRAWHSSRDWYGWTR
jgi:branched-chain amino acid transport system ATP-binding protein